MLQCLQDLPFKPHQYQIETAHRILHQMDCRALIADEVGLGKTIEAGLVIKELVHQDKNRNILVLTPATLLHQWCDELYKKFDLNFWICRKGPWGWDYNFVIGSLDKAKRAEHREMLLSRFYDLVIVDEAHKLKNRKTENWKLVNDLKTRGLILLTATPLQNNLEEIYNLVSLVRPTLFRDYKSFLEYYQLHPNALMAELKDKLSDIMIRNLTRDQTEKKVQRRVQLIPIRLRPEEKQIYEALQELRGSFLRLTLTKEYCSSPSALYATLQNMGREELLPLLEECPLPMKLYHLQAILQKHPGKILVFTEYMQTQFFIGRWLNELGINFIHFNGKLRRNQKEYTKWLFQNKDYRVMICTDSGSQGLNFQFCNVIVNFDLPWNPMKVEQRIGRIDRLGQTADEVYVYNFVLQDTVEEKIFHILGSKIALFKECIGELDNILTGDEDTAENEKLLKSMLRL